MIMKFECSHCHRQAPGDLGSDVSHGYCAKCMFCIEMVREAEEKGIALAELIDEPGREQEIIDAINRDDETGLVGEWNMANNPDAEEIFKKLERKAKRSREAPPDRR